MKLTNRILSTLLAVVMILGTLTFLSVTAVSAAETEGEATAVALEDYPKTVFNTPQEKIATMKVRLERDGYKLYVDDRSGEIAVLELATGQILFSNPYDTASSTGSESTKKQILSQLIIQYVDNGTTKYLYSFEEAALRNQISVSNIKNGVRVEYTIGREESRKLVPRWISSENFEKYIDKPLKNAMEKGDISEFFYKKFMAFYDFKALSKQTSKKAKQQLILAYPICEEMDIYVFATDASSVELNFCESYIKAYCEDYTFEMMDADHDQTGYVATDEEFPVFKMALEYSLDKDGLVVRLPCNGLRYNMSSYTLEYISVLPYMGAGNSKNAGYNFYPDGSGSLFDFEQLNTKSTTTIRGKVYGIDYAYHQISGTYQKAIRYPVYGTIASEKFYTYSYTVPDEETKVMGDPITVTVSNTVKTLEKIKGELEKQGAVLVSEITETGYQRGYAAIIESGESLAEIATYHAGALSDYNTMINYFNPKPKDSYDIADSISVTSSSTWTVVSNRKYTGNLRIRYRMLADSELAKTAQAADSSYTYYETTWLGMAEVYRDYLLTSGKLTKLTEEETQKNIPLYLETFGALETQQTILTVPVNVMTPLTTFENVMEMFRQLSEKGVGNINFKLTGYANGGMYSKVPSSLKWESAVGGKSGFKDLIQKAQEINTDGSGTHIGLYPDFDFAYINNNTLFDATKLKDDAIKTIDNRYSSKRLYSATQQKYISFYQLAVSPSRYSKFYTKLLKNYAKYDLNTMSVGTLGNTLNSDFDEDEPFNREDGKEFTVQAFEDLRDAGYSLMTDSGNAYTWGYVDHMINVDLDSSRYIKSSCSVPFIGAVLHGYIQFAGTPLNEEGDTDYAILRAVENGAGMYFILSYQNTNELKEDVFLSQYYSVRYDIWYDDVVAFYNKLNGLLKDVQNKVIIDHKFLIGERVLDLDELEADINKQLIDAAAAEKKKQDNIEVDKIIAVADARTAAINAKQTLIALSEKMAETNRLMDEQYTVLKDAVTELPDRVDLVVEELKATEGDITDESVAEAVTALKTYLNMIKSYTINVMKYGAELKYRQQQANDLLETVRNAKGLIENAANLTEEVRQILAAEAEAGYNAALPCMTAINDAITLHANEYETGDETALKIAMNALTLIAATGENADYNDELQTVCAGIVYTEQDILDAAVYEENSSEEEKTDETQTESEGKYKVDNNMIVAVTYGDRDDTTHAKTAYKTFILNYNNFSVRVTYGTMTYTIPGGGYVVIYN